MIQEYEEVRRFLKTMVINSFSEATVKVEDMFTDEFNAYEFQILGSVVSDKFYNRLKNKAFEKYSQVIESFDFVSSGGFSEQATIIVYLRTPIDIRYEKIDKIKSKIAV